MTATVRFLVFGGLGQLGRELQLAARRKGVALTAVGHRDADVGRPDSVRDAIVRARPDVVVNAAAYTKVDLAEAEPVAAWTANCLGAATVASECAAADVPLVHLSTDYVFDGSKPSAYDESDAVAPLGVYGASKEAGEKAVRAAWHKHLILRTAWVYGRFGSNFLKTMVRLARERESLRVVSDQVGNPTATEDLAEAVLCAGAGAAASDDRWGTYHFAGSEEASWHEFAVAIVEAQASRTGRRPPVAAIPTVEFPTPARRPANSRLDSARFISAFGLGAASWRSRVGPVVNAVLEDAPVPP
ncbi:dTDP-4-dehydrorhamnose reductase [Reyranella sp.]|uniref:dTDP-4-dehydrorhamnose reductase n=1 Tax=Reyranella sp. TaxID=1929291 RepID=UPI003BA8A1B0